MPTDSIVLSQEIVKLLQTLVYIGGVFIAYFVVNIFVGVWKRYVP